MPIPSRAVTVAAVAATILTAAGLNLSVMSIGRVDGAAAVGGDQSVSAELVDVELTAAAEPDPAVADESQVPQEHVLDVIARLSADSSAPSGRSTGSLASSSDDGDHGDGGHDDGDGEHRQDDSAPVSSTQPSSTPIETTVTARATTTTRPPSTAATRPPSTAATPAPTVASTMAPESAPVHTDYLTYDVRGVAVVVIALHNGKRLEFWSADPQPGWEYRVDEVEDDLVKIKFRPANEGDEAEFVVKIQDDGEIKVKMED